MSVEILERRERFNTLLPQLVTAYSLDSQADQTGLAPLQTHAISPLFEHVREGISASLPLAKVEQATTKDEIAQATTECGRVLTKFKDDVHGFANALCRQVVQIQVRGDVHPDAMQAALDKTRLPLLQAMNEIALPLPPALSAGLIVRPLEVVQESVRCWVQESCRAITEQLVMALHKLVEMEVVGLIEWKSEDVCQLHFFRQTILQDHVQSQRSTAVRRIRRNLVAFEEWEQLRARNRVIVERHEHHLMNAQAHVLGPGQAQFPIPREYDDLLNRIPEWLRPQVRVLEGTLIQEHVDSRQIREERWKSERVLRDSRLIQPRVRNAYEVDPALLLGHFVLAGWGQYEVERELFRQEREQEQIVATQEQEKVAPTQQEFREAADLQSVSNAAAVAAVVMMLFSPMQHRVMLPLALLLSVAAVFLWGRSLFLQSRKSAREATLLNVIGQCCQMAFGVLAVQAALFGILFGSWSMLGLAIPLGMAWALIRQLSPSRQQM